MAQSALSDDTQWHTVTIRIPFLTAEHAIIAKRVIEVDKELQPHVVKRTIEVQNDVLVCTLQSFTVRLARLTTNSFLENVELVVRTLAEFGDDAAACSASPTQ